MVNPGHRSRGCHSCRQAKVKCDEVHPSCERCVKKGKDCIWTEDGYKSMNSWARTNVEARVVKRKNIRHMKQNSSPDSVLQPLSPLVPLDWVSEAIGPFFKQFVSQPDTLEATYGQFATVPHVYEDSPAYLRHAIDAAAVAHLANKSLITKLEGTASKSYQKSMFALRELLDRPERAPLVPTLLTVMLLVLYESISGTRPSKEMFDAHVKGQASLLRYFLERNQTPEDLATDDGIVGTTTRILICRDLDAHHAPDLSLCSWAPSTYRSWLDEASTRVCILAATACSRVRSLQELHSLPTAEYLQHLSGCVWDLASANYTISTIFRTAPDEWKPKPSSQHLSDPRHSDQLFRNDIYPSASIAHLWNAIRYARLHVLRSMLSLYTLALFPEAQVLLKTLPAETKIRKEFDVTVEDIIASTGYLVGDVKDEEEGVPKLMAQQILLWQLQKVYNFFELEHRVRERLEGVFERIGRGANIRLAGFIKR